MDILSTAYYESMRRYWRRRKYRRLSGGAAARNKKKLKIRRLGRRGYRRLWKIRLIPKLQLNMASPVKLLVKFHDAYIDMMIRLVGNAGSSTNIGLFRGRLASSSSSSSSPASAF